VKGAGLGDLLGGSGDNGGITRTRRGLEKTLFQITIGLGIAFLAIAILSVAYAK
jgi:protein translocase SecG subunit